jgi:ubiquinone/menaquinone biosynthesis C-methylase UbiE
MSASQPKVSAARYIDNLQRISRLSRSLVQQAVAALKLDRASRGLDVACGIGLDSLVLGEALGGSGKVTGLDVSSEMLAIAQKKAKKSSWPEMFHFEQGQMEHLPFADNAFDWLWCKDAFWPMPSIVQDPIRGLEEFLRVLRPGGRIALFYWSSQTLLAGYPGLEARLQLQLTQTLPYLKGVVPEYHFFRALGWMREVGICDAQMQGLSACIPGPLNSQQQDSLNCICEMFYSEMEPQVSPSDWSLLQALTSPKSKRYLPLRSDYCLVINYLLFFGSKPAA